MMNRYTQLLLSAACLMGAVAGVQAQEQTMEHHHHDAVATAGASAMSTGEVVKIDRELGKITLRHGPLDNLGMPGMTMAFKVGQPAMLDRVKPGDKVRFVAERAGSGLAVTTLEIVD